MFIHIVHAVSQMMRIYFFVKTIMQTLEAVFHLFSNHVSSILVAYVLNNKELE